jgi:hypothetical protein
VPPGTATVTLTITTASGSTMTFRNTIGITTKPSSTRAT